MRRFFVLLAATLVAASAAAQKPEKSALKVGIIPISNMTPLYAAQKLGYFKDEGLTVETTIATGGPALTGALIGGSLDFIYSSYVSVFQASAQGFGLTIVAHQNSAQAKAPDAAAIVVPTDSTIQKPADLAGKRLALHALTSINHITARHLMDTNGIPTDSVKFVEIPFNNMADMLGKGQADAAFLVEPFITLMRQGGKLRPIAYPFIDTAPGLDIAGFVAAKKFAAENPVTVEKFVKALARGNEFLNANRDERIKYVAEFTKTKPEVISELTLDRWSHVVNEKHLQTLSDLSFKYGFQKSAVKVGDLLHKTALK